MIMAEASVPQSVEMNSTPNVGQAKRTRTGTERSKFLANGVVKQDLSLHHMRPGEGFAAALVMKNGIRIRSSERRALTGKVDHSPTALAGTRERRRRFANATGMGVSLVGYLKKNTASSSVEN